MTVMYPTKEEWMKETIDLLAEREKQIAEYRRDGADIPNSVLEVAGEIRNTIQQRSTWTEADFNAWRNAPVEGEVGYEEHQRDYPHLQPLWDDTIPRVIDYAALLRKANATAETNMNNAVVAIDEFLGMGFARDHPTLIGAYMQAVGTVYAGELIVRQLKAGFGEIG